MTEVGIVEVLCTRVYNTERGEFAVPPGVYPVVFNKTTGRYSWRLEGRSSKYGVTTDRIGDGMFAVGAGDTVTGQLTSFPYGYWTPAEFAGLLADPVATEGHPAQRLSIRMTVAVTA